MTTTTAGQPAATPALIQAAFGEQPDRWPLRPASSQRELWLRAVVAGGQGRYGSALADLDAVRRMGGAAVERSLAHSTQASFLRQLGDHDRARGWDGRAWAAAGDDPDAGADSLIGLAADALGVGRFGTSERLLDRAVDPAAAGSPRLMVRLGWVSAELAMARGKGGAAVEHAERAVDLAARLGSTRHQVKSTVVLAAALCSAGAVERSRQLADGALATTERYGLLPLRWAVCCLLAGIGSSTLSAERVVAVREETADTVRRRGGLWTHR